MGTRGAIGFTIDGQNKLTYNHMDSYPEWLGARILAELHAHDIDDEARERIKNLRMVNDEEEPTEEDIERYSEFTNTEVGSQSTKDWYCLLRGLQGDLLPYMDGRCEVMMDRSNFILDSLFCEWAWIINLDTNEFEVYEGFQYEPQEGNRFGQEVGYTTALGKDYYPCRLVCAFPLDDLPDIETVIQNTYSDEDLKDEKYGLATKLKQATRAIEDI